MFFNPFHAYYIIFKHILIWLAGVYLVDSVGNLLQPTVGKQHVVETLNIKNVSKMDIDESPVNLISYSENKMSSSFLHINNDILPVTFQHCPEELCCSHLRL